nr:serine/threonine-protein kinase D6PKL1 [Ipomoea batatas]
MEAKVAPLPRSYPVRLRALKRWEEDVMPDAGSFKRSSDSYVDSGSNSFHGVSHPPEPIDIDLMRPVYVPISQDKGNGKCLREDFTQPPTLSAALSPLSLQISHHRRPLSQKLICSRHPDLRLQQCSAAVTPTSPSIASLALSHRRRCRLSPPPSSRG